MSLLRHVALLGLGLTIACAAPPPIETVEDLTKALENNGITFDSATRVDLSGMGFAQVDEGVRLTGDGVHVELLRVEDEGTFKIVSSLGGLLKALNDKLGEAPLHPPDVIARYPFVVVVRKEPDTGRIRRIVDRVLPAE